MKKFIAFLLTVVLTATIAIGGTVAYLQDDDSDVNVMTLGNVKIEQHEYERVVNADGTFATDTIDNQTSYVLKDFTQGKPLLPSALVTNGSGWDWDSTIVRMTQVDSYGGMQVFKAASNAQDKFVTVENTGKTDAYIRTLVAIEIGSADGSLIGTSYHSTWNKTEIGEITIDGNTYVLIEYAYEGGELTDGTWRHQYGILPAGDTSYPNLSQVYISAAATNEDMVKLDGNGNGTLDILVFSQAVQAAGFDDAETALDAAFGDITTTNHPWAGEGNEPVIPVVVHTAEELSAALAEGGNVVLVNDVKLDDAPITIAADTTLNLNGNTLTGQSTANTTSNLIKVQQGSTLTISNGTVSFAATEPDVNWGGEGQPAFPGYANNTISNSGKLVIDGATIVNKTAPGGASYAIDNYPGADLVINDGVIDGQGKTAIRMFCNSTTVSTNVTINGGTITGSRPIWIQLPGSNANQTPPASLTINGGVLKSTNDPESNNWMAIYSYSYGQNASGVNVTITGGTFDGHVGFGGGSKNGTENVTITGGTFNGDLGRYLANDGWEDIAKP